MTNSGLYNLAKEARFGFLKPFRQRNFFQNTAKNTAQSARQLSDVGPIDASGLAKWTAGAGAGAGFLGYQGSPSDKPNTYLNSGLGAALAMLLTRGRGLKRGWGLTTMPRRYRFPTTLGAGIGGTIYGSAVDRNNAIREAERIRKERNLIKLKSLFGANRFINGRSFGVRPDDYRYNSQEVEDLKSKQYADIMDSQTQKPDYKDYPGLRIPFFDNSGWSE